MKNTIFRLRKQHKITQEELANKVGVTRQTITSIETGKYIASLPLAFKIAKFFDMSIEEIFSICLLYTSPSPRDGLLSRMPSSA